MNTGTLKHLQIIILCELRANGPQSRTQLASTIGEPVERISNALHRLYRNDPPLIRHAIMRDRPHDARSATCWEIMDELPTPPKASRRRHISVRRKARK